MENKINNACYIFIKNELKTDDYKLNEPLSKYGVGKNELVSIVGDFEKMRNVKIDKSIYIGYRYICELYCLFLSIMRKRKFFY